MQGNLVRRLTLLLVAASILICAAIFARQIQVWRAAADVTTRIELLNGGIGVWAGFSGPDEIVFAVEGLEPLVDDDDLEDMSRSISSLRIRSVILTNTKITDRGLQALVNSCRHSLRTIELSGTEISDKSLRALAKCRNLRRVSIPVAALDENGVSYLASMKGLKNVDVYECKSNEKSIDVLRKEIGDRVAIRAHSKIHFLKRSS